MLRPGCHQLAGVRVAGGLQHLGGRALLDDTAMAQYRDPPAQVGCQFQVMGDGEQALALRLGGHQQGSNLGAGLGVQALGGLVGNQQAGTGSTGAGHPHALRHAA